MIPFKARRLLMLAVALLASGMAAVAENPAPSLPQVAVPPLTLGQYVTQLERLSATAGDLQAHPEKISQLRAELPREWAVQTGSGVIQVRTARLGNLLQRCDAEPENRERLARRIQADLAEMRHQAAAMGAGPQDRSDAAARSKLNEILSRREFNSVHGPNAWDEMWAKIQDWVERLLDKIFGRLHISRSVGSVISWTVITFAFLVVVWLIARNLLAQSRGFSLHLEAPAQKHQSSWEWLKAARRAADAGDFREAIHCAYWAAVYRLGEAGVWRLDATRTPREYLRLLRTERPEWPPMSEITRNFEVVWYGDRPASAGNFQTAMEGLEKLGCHLP